jgi:hypothetical protein
VGAQHYLKNKMAGAQSKDTTISASAVLSFIYQSSPGALANKRFFDLGPRHFNFIVLK